MDFFWDNFFQNKNKEETIENHLTNNVLFKDLTVKELKLVKNIVNQRHYRPGEEIFHQGDVGLGMYIICKGDVDIYVEKTEAADSLAKDFITQLHKGDFFGELSLVETKGFRSATAIAKGEVSLIGFFKPDLLEIIERNPTAGVKILFNLGSVIGTRLRATTSKISDYKKTIKESGHVI